MLFRSGISSGFQQKLAVDSDAYFKPARVSFQCSPLWSYCFSRKL